MKFQSLWVTFALIGLIAFCFIAFIVQFETDNDKSNGLLENQIINRTYGNLQSDLSTFGSQAQGQKDVFESETPTISFGALILFAIVSAGKVFTNMLIGIFNILIFLPTAMFGISPVITGVLSSILIISIIFLLWRVYKAGE
jgi:hypothetical protein